MAVEQTMAELNITWWNLLQKIAVNLRWSYAALWETPDGREELRWKEGYFNCSMPSNGGDANTIGELFYSLYTSCTFTSGVGFAGHSLANMTNRALWLTGNELTSLECPLDKQMYFLREAGIRTIICVPLGLPLRTLVLELGTVETVLETDDVASHIMKYLDALLTTELPHLVKEDSMHRPGDQFRQQAVQTPVPSTQGVQFGNSSHPSISLAMRNQTELVPPVNELNLFSQSGLGSKPQQLGPIYQELLQEQNNYARQVPQSVLNIVPPQLDEFPESTLRERLPWARESASPLLPMESNGFLSWTATLADSLPGSVPTCSATSQLVEEIDPVGVGQLLPFDLDQSLNAFTGATQPRIMAGTSLHASSSRSSIRSQTLEDNEISSAFFESYPEMESRPFGRSSSTGPAESASYWRGEARQSSGPSSKETSPDNSVAPLRQAYGIHPRISNRPQKRSSTTTDLLALQHSSAPQEDDGTPRLVKFGNVLQLGNKSGHVVEAIPQEHDEAALSHMLAERRRRNKQKENLNQLKALIPGAAKMDKISLLAATILYINKLEERVRDLEQSNESLQLELSARETQSTNGLSLILDKQKGSPTRARRVRSPKSLSPAEEDKIGVLPDGDGNLTIEIRNSCSQPDLAIHIFACLKKLQFKIMNMDVVINDNRIHATIVVKMKRKNFAGQSAVCAEVESSLRQCLSNLG